MKKFYNKIAYTSHSIQNCFPFIAKFFIPLLFISTTLLTWTIGKTLAAETSIVFFEPGTGNIHDSQILSLKVDSGAQQTGFVRIAFMFDVTKIQLANEITINPVFENVIGQTSKDNANTSGYVIIDAAVSNNTMNSAPQNEFEFAQIPLQVISEEDNDSVVLSFIPADSQIVTMEANNLTFEMQNGTYTLNFAILPTPSNTPTLTSTESPTPTLSPSPTDTVTPTSTTIPTPTATPTVTETLTPTISPTPTATTTPTNTPTPSDTPTPTSTPSPTVTPSIAITTSPTAIPTTIVTMTPTISSTNTPSPTRTIPGKANGKNKPTKTVLGTESETTLEQTNEVGNENTETFSETKTSQDKSFPWKPLLAAIGTFVTVISSLAYQQIMKK